jgi:site-specific recombinase XerD
VRDSRADSLIRRSGLALSVSRLPRQGVHSVWCWGPLPAASVDVRQRGTGYWQEGGVGVRGDGEAPGTRTRNRLIKSQQNTLSLLNKLPVSTLAELSGLSKSYISQVRHGKCPPSQRLIEALAESPDCRKPDRDYLKLFVESRMAVGVSPKTIRFYRERLSKFVAQVDCSRATRQQVERYLNSIPPNRYGLGNRHASYRAIKAFCHWLNAEHDIPDPTKNMTAPMMGKPILPSLSRDEVELLIEKSKSTRDKAIIALFTESGLRLSELAGIRARDIDWNHRTVRVMGKGRKEAYAPFGALTEQYLREWLAAFQPNGCSVWGLSEWGIVSMLRYLSESTGLTCNPHTFRRTFAVLLRKAGVDTMTIRDLGRWESVQMVERYTRSFGFSDAMKFYKPPLG